MTPKRKKDAVHTVAAVDVGASAVRMVIGEVDRRSNVTVIENLQQPAGLGRDAFVKGKIARSTAQFVLKTLKNYANLMQTYGVKTYRAVATSALREASNRDIFRDRVYAQTGIDIEVIDGMEESRLVFSAAQRVLERKLRGIKGPVLMLEVGAGCSTTTLIKRNSVTLSQTFNIGSLRSLHHTPDGSIDRDGSLAVIRDAASSIVRFLKQNVDLARIRNIVAVSGDARFVARRLHPEVRTGYVCLGDEEFFGVYETVCERAPDEIVENAPMSLADAELLTPALTIYAEVIRACRASSVIVPMISIRDGLLDELAKTTRGKGQKDFSRQVVTAAKALAEKFMCDERHGRQVAKIALRLFDEMLDDHHLGDHERLLLEVAAILHDIGAFIAMSSHHKHGAYVVQHAELFGLKKPDLRLIANLVRYHRRSLPKPSHIEFTALTRIEQLKVLKLAAILRVADALDRGHARAFENFVIEHADDEIVIRSSGNADLSYECAALEKKGDLFGEVFGVNIRLE